MLYQTGNHFYIFLWLQYNPILWTIFKKQTHHNHKAKLTYIIIQSTRFTWNSFTIVIKDNNQNQQPSKYLWYFYLPYVGTGRIHYW